MIPIADQGHFWQCSKCPERTLRHREYCDSCGEPRPAPLPEAEPSDIGRPDAALEAQMQRADEPDISGLTSEQLLYVECIWRLASGRALHQREPIICEAVARFAKAKEYHEAWRKALTED